MLWNIADGTIDSGPLEGIDAVVHLAGEGIADGKWTAERKRAILESREMGTRLLSTTLAELRNPPNVFLSGSAIGIYGNRGDLELTEQSERGNGFLADVVVDWETAGLPAAEAGIRTVFIRSGIVLGIEGGALAEQLPFFKWGIGGRIGDGLQYWSWISIDDHVGALLHLIDSNVSGPVNLTSPNPVTNGEFTKALGKALRRPTMLPTPMFALNLRLGSELVDAMLLGSIRVVGQVLLDSGYVFKHETIDEAFATEIARG